MTSPCPASFLLSTSRLLLAVALTVGASSLLTTPAYSAAALSADSLDVPAQRVDEHLPAPLLSVATAGNTMIGVGLHGLIQRSTDEGRTWQQVASPVSSDLVQVRFRGERDGWIVGHDAVVMHTTDGGESWQVQLDGRRLLTLLNAYYGPRAEQGDEVAAQMLKEVAMAASTSATPDVLAAPFLDVMFDEHGSGFAVGAFGMLLHSTDDGQNWQPWTERSDNDRRMHLYGLAEQAGTFYIGGEQGLLLRLDGQQQRFVKIDTPYTGTYFGVRAFDGLLLAYGLRGNLFASRDDGQQWQPVATNLNSSLVSIVEQGDALIVVSQGGQLVSVDRQSLQVTPLADARVGEVYAASATKQAGSLLVTRFSGAKVIDIAQAN
ncbi:MULTISPECIES: YCF48-related protein [Pseudomonas]|uniref:Photosynthesis system II assembly factor Ycf48/Hcf136-like domain-containing protein n=1 Tax=Pseudomonas mandelii TaxID=75612 RepID=A0ABY0VTI3_9PSED|nr:MULTISPECIES: YCF48-related protein [Pseudomonas]MBU0523178.1 glycosyl hydrolase [Gammaproteobacteria bacterium]MBU0821469.1 glycosyl hydrolase [Gammaproteobacteria bacterium]MBU0840758.1 glycosyl hydrolase [Gammaproteobacteria bacterium]MBU1839563.1 glycosyl hydrolase [Gammaproteobacteria bacterium]MSU93135.1 glycosyl hydrolase [Pseudomonas mandelii]